ncbi:sialoadhesin-like [Centropristis striata]|uniref:sialoadhesin-like n=1 Tax=Centropristis striata TaxID=184440 RepID=UPI0027DF8605|nr:sialoadhesin-like [Centropristis striata]
MEVTALCSRLNVTFPRIVVSRLQLFEYESLSVSCEGFFNDLVEWRVMRKIKGISTICNTDWETKGPCTITTVFSMDSGEYWCEAAGKRSRAVNITVTLIDSVILESPALPVTEGESVTLSCRNKETSYLTADFYKDGLLLLVRENSMTIRRVSKSDEGLYKCSISGAGESAESWLAVRAFDSVTLESPALPVMEGESVTLRCRNKKTSNLEAVFYKDGRLISSSSTGETNIYSVSKSDEGLYKCSIPHGGESAESWLAVRGHQEASPVRPSPHVFTLLWIIVTFVLLALLLLFLLMLHFTNLKVHTGSSVSPPSFPMVSLIQTEEDEPRTAAVYYTLSMSN